MAQPLPVQCPMHAPSTLLVLILASACAAPVASDIEAVLPPSDSSTAAVSTGWPSSTDSHTSQEPSEEPADIAHVVAIRKALRDDDGLSLLAKNVAVLARSGAVTLHGQVLTLLDRSRVEHLAASCAATTSVDDRIRIDPE